MLTPLGSEALLDADPDLGANLDPADFDLTHCHAAMARVRALLDDGVRFALVDRMPLDDLSPEAASAIYWLPPPVLQASSEE